MSVSSRVTFSRSGRFADTNPASRRGKSVPAGVRSGSVELSAWESYVVRKTNVSDPLHGTANVYFRVQRSEDCGVKWSAPTNVNGNGPVETLYTDDFCGFSSSTGGRLHARSMSSDAWIATGPKDGEVYVSYVAIDQSQHSQVYMGASEDHGQTWTNRRVTDGLNNSGFPEIAVASNGTIAVMFIDCASKDIERTFRHRLSQSADRGIRWRTVLLQEMNPLQISFLVENWWDNNNQYLWGDYEGLTAARNKFYGVFTGRSINRKTPQLDPIFFSIPAD
jgi:hypothetical protein